jgi:hypothetical protein
MDTDHQDKKSESQATGQQRSTTTRAPVAFPRIFAFLLGKSEATEKRSRLLSMGAWLWHGKCSDFIPRQKHFPQRTHISHIFPTFSKATVLLSPEWILAILPKKWLSQVKT